MKVAKMSSCQFFISLCLCHGQRTLVPVLILGEARIHEAIEDSSSSNREVCLKARETLKATKRGKVIENGQEGQVKSSP